MAKLKSQQWHETKQQLTDKEGDVNFVSLKAWVNRQSVMGIVKSTRPVRYVESLSVGKTRQVSGEIQITTLSLNSFNNY